MLVCPSLSAFYSGEMKAQRYHLPRLRSHSSPDHQFSGFQSRALLAGLAAQNKFLPVCPLQFSGSHSFRLPSKTEEELTKGSIAFSDMKRAWVTLDLALGFPGRGERERWAVLEIWSLSRARTRLGRWGWAAWWFGSLTVQLVCYPCQGGWGRRKMPCLAQAWNLRAGIARFAQNHLIIEFRKDISCLLVDCSWDPS